MLYKVLLLDDKHGPLDQHLPRPNQRALPLTTGGDIYTDSRVLLNLAATSCSSSIIPYCSTSSRPSTRPLRFNDGDITEHRNKCT